jgi:ABC-type transport system substrate-binding protein
MTINHRGWRWVVIVGVFALVAAACSSGDDNTVSDDADASAQQTPTSTQPADSTEPTEPTPDDTPSEPADSGSTEAFTFTVAIFEDLTTDNYWAYTDPESSVWNAYVLSDHAAALFNQQPPANTLVPSLAEGLPAEPVENGDVWTITQPLRQGVQWSDGEAIDANDVVFTAQTAIDLQLGGNWLTNYPTGVEDDPATADVDEFQLGIVEVRAVDDHTVAFDWNAKPGLSFWQFGAAVAPILPEHFWADAVAAATAPEDLYAVSGVGAPSAHGFRYDTTEPGAFARNVANPNYSFADATHTFYDDGSYRFTSEPLGIDETHYGDGSGDVVTEYAEGPFAEEIVYSIYSTQDAAVLALQRGEVDFLLNSLGLQRGLALPLIENPDLDVITNPNNGYRYMAYNMRKFPMDQVAFRQALACMIDREFMATNVLQGVAIPLATQVPPGNSFWHDPDVPILCDGLTPEERLAEATQILKDGGFTWDVEPGWDVDNLDAIPKGEGLRGPDGTLVPELELLAPGPGYDPLRATYSLFVEDWANDLGIPLVAEPTGFNVIVDKVFTDDPQFDLYILGWSLTPFPNHLFNFFASSQDAASGGNNTPGYSNPDYDALAAQFNEATDVDEARELVSQMDRLLAEDMPYVVLFTTPILEAHSNSVRFPFTETLSGIQNIQGLPLSVQLSE